MKRVELEIEHRYKGEFLGRHRFKAETATLVLGSSRNADVRLLGEEVSGIHAVVEFEDGNWTIGDMRSESGTWFKKKPIVEHKIEGVCSFRIGAHELKMVPKVIENQLFAQCSEQPDHKGEGSLYHQVIVRKADMVVETRLLPVASPFEFSYGGKVEILPPPKSKSWQSTQFDSVLVQQRQVKGKQQVVTMGDLAEQYWDPSLHRPFLAAFVMMLIVSALVIFAPTGPEEELTELKPEKNRYTRMIYDTKFARTKRKQALKVTKNIQAKTRPVKKKSTTQAAGAPSAKKKSNAPKAVSKIRASGLSQLIGKISKRAAKTAKHIQRNGKSPDSAYSGRALASVGGLASVAAAAGKTKSFRIKGVGTKSAVGAKGSLKGVGSLSPGSVGNSSVGIIEEETEIQGGLDRDVIARVIAAQLGQIRYCYERQLSARPDMYGKVMVRFTIGANGSVVTQNIGRSTLKNAMVEGCMLRRVAGWRFPQPEGGTSVLVTYPFLFKSTN